MIVDDGREECVNFRRIATKLNPSAGRQLLLLIFCSVRSFLVTSSSFTTMAQLAQGKNWVTNVADIKEMLSKWREENNRCSLKLRDVYSYFNLDSELGDEKWPAMEQICLAAIDLQDHQLIKLCLEDLMSKFPGSTRVKRLRIMARLEMRERFEEALKAYDELIHTDESNAIHYKRKVAILISQRKIAEAIRELVDYLKKFMNDQEAWLELSDLYIQEQEYQKAAFCLEELILTNSNNHFYYQKYADIQYTINTAESHELAKTYYSQALKLNPSNARALFGLYLSAASLSCNPKVPAPKKKENQKLVSWSLEQINQMYSNINTELPGQESAVPIEGLMSALQINSAN